MTVINKPKETPPKTVENKPLPAGQQKVQTTKVAPIGGPRPAQGPIPKSRPGIINAKVSDIDAAKIFAELKNNYVKKSRNKVNIMLAGDSGSGKTHLLKTMPGPIYIDSFDPDGLKTLTEEIDTGLVIPMTKWETDNPKAPSQFKAWDDHFLKLYQSGFFEHVGTYVLDSLTTWADALMSFIIANDSRPNTAPQLQDYGLQQVLAKTAVKMIAGLPCNTVITAHLDTMKDEVTGQVMAAIMMPGKSSVKLPLEISEMYVLEVRDTMVNGNPVSNRTLLTRKTGKYRAKTRMGRNELFDMREPADLGALMRKAGLDTTNKPFGADFGKPE